MYGLASRGREEEDDDFDARKSSGRRNPDCSVRADTRSRPTVSIGWRAATNTEREQV